MRILLTISLSVYVLMSFAQTGGEEKVSLLSNPVLQAAGQVNEVKIKSSGPMHNTAYNKAPFFNTLFPFVDWFDQDTTELNDTMWALHLVKIQQGAAVLNAQDTNENTYAPADGSVGITDILASQNINIFSSNGSLFVEFIYSTGATWKPTDELSLELKTRSGVFTSVWTDGSIAANRRAVFLPIDLSIFASDTFAFRFICRTERSNTNTSVFLMHHVNLSDKPGLPWYENFVVPNASNSLRPSPVFWSQLQPDLYSDGSISGTRSCVFNAYSRFGDIYSSNGYGDTLMSQPMDMTTYPVADSVYFRFLYKKYAAANGTDTLLLDFLDATDQWVRIWQISGAQAGLTYVPFIRQMNLPEFRHDHFRVRVINKCDYTSTDTLQFGATGFHIGEKIKLPFIDDFSKSELYPSSTLWKDREVFINNDFAIAPPSVNVATFDGLDEKGNAYGQGEGYLDSLTSRPLNLNGFTRADSIYLSFYVQPQGLGDIPEPGDSLVLEFRSSPFYPTAWHTVWAGIAGGYSTTAFAKITVFIDSVYLNDDFQFRFKNIGSRTGNLDNWHVDYIILDKGRSLNSGYFDFSLSANPPSLLKKYTAMPWNHYSANPAAYTNTLQQILVSNNDKSTVPMNFARTIYNPEGILLDSFFNTNPGVSAESRSNVAITSLLGALTTAATATDSVLFNAKYYTNSNNNFDNIATNDTLSVQTVMSNYFAYDDGTAEAGYGIANQPGAVALGYTLEAADSVYGISMFFNQAEVDVSTQSFNIVIWSKIGSNGDGTGEVAVKKINQSRPTYKDHRNGFYFLKFDQPQYMPKGKFYIGWEQSNIFNLNMGLDMNYQVAGAPVKNPDMWFKVYGVWAKTQLEGALMMRPLVGKWIEPPVGVKEEQKEVLDVVVYPNPARDRVFVRANTEHDFTIELFDISGKMLLSDMDNQKSLPLDQLTGGIYFVRIKDVVTGSTLVKKLLINQ